MKYSFILFFSLSCFFGYSQSSYTTIDDYYRQIITKYQFDEKDLDKAIVSLEANSKINPKYTDIYFETGILEYYRGRYAKSIYSFNQYLTSAQNSFNADKIYIVKRFVAGAYARIGDYSKAEKFYHECIQYYEKNTNYGMLSIIYNNIASTIYVKKKNYDSALVFYQKAMKYDSLTHEKKLHFLIKVSLIHVYASMQKYQESYQTYLEILKTPYIRENKRVYYNFLGNSISVLLYYQKNDTVQKYFEETEEYALKSGMYDFGLHIYKEMLEYYYKTKQYDKFFRYQNRWADCRDSAEKENDRLQIQKIELDKLEHEKRLMTQLLVLQKVKTTRRNFIILFLITLIALVVSVAFSYYRKLNFKRIREAQILQKKLLIELQTNHSLMQSQIQQLQENEKLKDYINAQLGQEVQKRTDELVQKEKEILSLKEIQLQKEKEKIEREALTQTLLLQQKNQIFEQIKSGMETITRKNMPAEQEKQIRDILMLIKRNLNIEQQWDSFKTYFEANFPAFMEDIIQKYPQLTTNDIRHIAYAKMGLSTKEVANLIGVEPKSVKMARYRIKQKLSAEKDKTLYEFLNEI